MKFPNRISSDCFCSWISCKQTNINGEQQVILSICEAVTNKDKTQDDSTWSSSCLSIHGLMVSTLSTTNRAAQLETHAWV